MVALIVLDLIRVPVTAIIVAWLSQLMMIFLPAVFFSGRIEFHRQRRFPLCFFFNLKLFKIHRTAILSINKYEADKNATVCK